MRAAKTALAEALRPWAKAQEQQTAAHVAGGVLNDGQQLLEPGSNSGGCRRDLWYRR